LTRARAGGVSIDARVIRSLGTLLKNFFNSVSGMIELPLERSRV
jgi:hypothetical protein